MPVLPVLPVASELRGHVGPLLEKVRESFAKEAGVELLPQGAEEVAREPLPAILFLTGGTEHEALAFASTTPRPLLLLAHRSHNSLPAALETLARLREEGRRAWIVTENLGEKLSLFSQIAEIARNLNGKRIGWIGGASPWLMASSQASEILAEKLGLKIVAIPLSAVLEALPAEGERPAGEGLAVGEAERGMAGRVYAALKSLIAKENFFAISIACFGLIPYGLTACYALARLSDEGIPGGCEGDLSGLFALILGKFLTGGPGFLANPVDFDLKRERLLLAHCTVPFSLAESFVFRTHFESGIGLAVGGRLKPGPYTLVRLGGLRLEKIFVVEGTVLSESPGREDLCRTQVWFKMPKGALEKLLREPLGNHHVLIPGHHRPILSLFHSVFLAG
jgi:L-fucose isomerase-like protein